MNNEQYSVPLKRDLRFAATSSKIVIARSEATKQQYPASNLQTFPNLH
jgi:hypothetical protein